MHHAVHPAGPRAVSRHLHAHVAALSPPGAPAVADNPVAGAGRARPVEADGHHGMVYVSEAAASKV